MTAATPIADLARIEEALYRASAALRRFTPGEVEARSKARDDPNRERPKLSRLIAVNPELIPPPPPFPPHRERGGFESPQRS